MAAETDSIQFSQEHQRTALLEAPKIPLQYLHLSPELLVDEIARHNIRLGNPELPTSRKRNEIMEGLMDSRVLLLVSPTATGKSTQLPQLALQVGFTRIIETQPRRKAAENIHNRIVSELDEAIGLAEAGGNLVRYQTGGGSEGPANAPIQIMTDGLLVTRVAHGASGRGEKWILDEIHESNQNMWYLLGKAKQRLAEDPDFSLVITTATADKWKYLNYFSNEDEEPTLIELESTMHHVESRNEPESDTVREAVKAAVDIHKNPDAHDSSNTIVIFESGKNELKDTINDITARLPQEILEKTTILKGHAKMGAAALAPIYEEMDGIKIVVQTNMGKTSHTIPKVRYVISSGEERQQELDDFDDTALVQYMSSQDCVIQEMGRAGRTNTGIFILTRHPNRPYKAIEYREPHLIPEILRVRPDRMALLLALDGDDIMTFHGIDEIPELRRARAVHRLQALGALDENRLITATGRRMAEYPLNTERARSMVEAEKYGAAVRMYMAAITASSEVGGLRLFEPGGTTEWQKLTNETTSDALAQLDIFIRLQDMEPEEVWLYDIDTNNYNQAKNEFRKIARRAGVDVIPPKLEMPSAADREIIRECIAAGYINSIYKPEGEGRFRLLGAQALAGREISNRSVVLEYTTSAVVGEPRNVHLFRSGKLEVKPIIEDVTEVSSEVIRRIGANAARWVQTGFQLRGGKFMAKQDQVFGSLVLDRREVPAEASPQLRSTVIEHVKNGEEDNGGPGKHLRSLYKIKSDLEKLAHRARYQIPRLTEDDINALIERATPDSVNSPSHVEENLRQIILDEGITLDKFLSFRERARIMKDSPKTLPYADDELKLWYRKGRVYAQNYKKGWIATLDETTPPRLKDGREVFFQYENRKYTLGQLKKVLKADGWN